MKDHSKMIRSLIIAIVSLLLCFVLIFGFTACGTEGPAGPAGPQGEQGLPGEKGDKGDPGEDGEDASSVGLTESIVTPTGTKSGFLENGGKFYSSADTIDEHRQQSREVAVDIGAEAYALLKNENNALPLQGKYVTLFGARSYTPATGGGGSGSASVADWMEPVRLTSMTVSGWRGDTYYRGSLEDAGFVVNPVVKELYGTSTNEIDVTTLGSEVTNSYGSYGDAAIVSFARTGSEGNDLQTTPDTENGTDHVLQLTNDEKAIIRHAKQYFDKVIVLLQTNNVMEVSELQAEKTATNLGVDAIILTGINGAVGYQELGKVLNGTLSPSGRTVDIWASDLLKGPEIANFGSQAHHEDSSDQAVYYYDTYNWYDVKTNSETLTRANDGTEDSRYYYLNDNGQLQYEVRSDQNPSQEYVTVEYREDIYMGYRYYETVAAEMKKVDEEAAEEWYDEAVTYPFGYGLSYTTFDWKFTSDISPAAKITDPHQTVTLDIQITNTGKVPGKDVVQIYYSAPYTEGGIQKAAVNMVDFGKTKLLQPGETTNLHIQFVAQDMASFDYNDANNNGFKGYELEAGDYIITACRDSHTPVLSVTRTVDETLECTTDYVSGKEIKPIFSGGVSGGEGYEQFDSMNQTLIDNILTRDDIIAAAKEGKAAEVKVNTKEDRTVSKEQYYEWVDQNTYFAFQDKETDPWYVSPDGMPSTWDQGLGEKGDDGMYELTLYDMAGVPYTEPTIDEDGNVITGTDEGSKLWEEFMNQLTWDELYLIAVEGHYGQAPVPTVGKRVWNDQDGPAQIGNGGKDTRFTSIGSAMAYPTAATIAQTFNPDLAFRYGEMVGDASIYANTPGWYAPSMNTHRSPFSGRNFEYYSEDGVLAGKVGAAAVLGAQSKGVVCYIKHMFLNDQEFGREPLGGVFTWASEQAMRELYLKPFEYAIKYGRATGVMSAFNRIGEIPSATNYAQNEQLLRQEWDFRGLVVTDSWNGQSAKSRIARPGNMLIRSGGDLALGRAAQSAQGNGFAPGRLYGVEGQSVEVWCRGNTLKQTGFLGDNPQPSFRGTADDITVNSETGAVTYNWTLNPEHWSAWDAEAKTVKVAPSWQGDMATGNLVAEVITNGESNYLYSNTQYFNVRKVAQRVLFANANSNHLRNGAYEPGWKEFHAISTANLTVNTEADFEIITDEMAIELFNTPHLIIEAAEDMPAGLSIEDNKIVGKPEAATEAEGVDISIEIFLPGGYRVANAGIHINITA